MFSASGSPLFSPDGNTLKLTRATHVLSPIESVLRGRGIGMESPGSPLGCKSSEVGSRMDMSEPAVAVAGTGMSPREDGNGSVEMPAGSLPLPWTKWAGAV
jgi:hypothetical protein